jgi:glucose-6-phosphate 1-dehydrogenase
VTTGTRQPDSDALVFFGATGDLAYKKIFPALHMMARRGRLRVPVVGVARSGWTLEQLKNRARESVREHGGGVDEAGFEHLCKLLRYVDGDYNDSGTFARMREELGEARRPTHYLAIPPSMFDVVIRSLGSSGCARDARVVVEKPFGRSYETARRLNAIVHEVFREPAVFRIDHYLGKEPVQNLLYFRFANSFLEPLWNRNYISAVHVFMAEELGVAGRGRFYEETGAIRDVVQNHLLQVVAFVAMEAPIAGDDESTRDEKVKVFKSIRPLRPEDVVCGQFSGYRDERGVAPDSQVETFVALRLRVDSWRWKGVPFTIRAGKRLADTLTEVRVDLHRPPQTVFPEDRRGAPNQLRFRLGPDMRITLRARVKRHGESMTGEESELSFLRHAARDDEMSAYERLLSDALSGDTTLFAREDGVEAAWRIVDPVIGEHTPALSYEPGSWGPKEADAIAPPPQSTGTLE